MFAGEQLKIERPTPNLDPAALVRDDVLVCLMPHG
jgi:hypothetical protein